MPEALSYYRPVRARPEALPSPESLDTAAAKSERELLKRIEAINRFVAEQNGERPVIDALAYKLHLSPQAVFQERKGLRVGYGQYAALRGVSYLGKGSVAKVVAAYERGQAWSDVARSNDVRTAELTAWIGDVIRTTNALNRRLRSQQYRPGYRMR